jgi:hypothetical protein
MIFRRLFSVFDCGPVLWEASFTCSELRHVHRQVGNAYLNGVASVAQRSITASMAALVRLLVIKMPLDHRFASGLIIRFSPSILSVPFDHF